MGAGLITIAIRNRSYFLSRESPQSALADDIGRLWQASLDAHGGVDRMQQSPQWLEHKLRVGDRTNIELTTVFDVETILGVVPTVRTQVDLSMRMAGMRLLGGGLPVRSILGNVPAVPADFKLMESMLLGLLDDDVLGVSIRMVPLRSVLYQTMSQLVGQKRGLALFSLREPFERHTLQLPGSFAQYLHQFDAKKRYNLKRQVRQLGMACGGEATLQEFSRPEQVEEFLQAIAELVDRSWQAGVTNDLPRRTELCLREYRSLAESGLFRSYVLYAGGQAAAYCVGLQYEDIYYFDATAYDPRQAAHSPGSVLLLMLVEALTADQDRRVRTVNFGYGDHDYKRSFGNVHELVAEVVLLKSTVGTRWKTGLYKSLQSCVNLLRGAR